MKKVMAIIFSIVVAISSVMLTTTTTATAVGNTTLLGDANQDGKLDTTDAIYILYYIALVCAGYPATITKSSGFTPLVEIDK